MSNLSSYFALIAKGIAMGAADVVPGVSGGTIAFITGIYDRLLNALKSINPSLLKVLGHEGVAGIWRRIDGTFLVCVFGGVLTSILLFAHVITWFLVTCPEMLWAFFFGLILVSGLHMIRQVHHWNISTLFTLIAGIVIAYAVGVLTPNSLEPEPVILFFAGAIAICAMILPGISGSFILLMMGLYSPVIDAVKSLNFTVLMIFGLGCIGGLLSFSHVLSWLLKKHRDLAISLLTGLMLGALGKVWPWKVTLESRVNSSGDLVPLIQTNVSPMNYEGITGQPAYLVESIGLMIFAIVLVAIIEWKGSRKH
ncbi:DUF368 domain-containing protein [Endozoicomonas sp. SCSIO W0465]|uniref:DUF368 domain-containing protein n=1 Tax=Endozoicomonas sp. SCSIO W0465 TaxID=2918516 RepID=UPI002074C451|nr:DUF368 domain-containing protein [Endozoicomonas sp. SCSIO W0465]USE33966.1 DUF368 domain-containing protein [Endozoicomonas sp. SCSIO W0465]